MFEHKKYILFIAKTSLKLAVALEDKNEKANVISEHDWSNETLASAFAKVKKIAPKVKVILDDDLAYTVTIPTSMGNLDRGQVEAKIKEFIPEDLNSTAWDYQLYSIPDEDLNKQHHYIQAVALKKSFFDPFIKAVEEVKLTIDAVEPMSSSLARLFSDSLQPIILVTDKPLILTCLYREMVLGIKKTTHEKLAKEIDQVASHLSTEFKKPFKRIIISPGLSTIPGLKALEEKGYTIELKTVDLLVSVSSQKTENTVQNIITPQPTIKPEVKLSEPDKSWMGIAIPVIVLILVGIGGYFGYQAFAKAKNTKPSPSPTPSAAASSKPSPSPSPVASITPAELKKYKVSVLNGTTIKGEAKKLGDMLTKEGFNVAKVGNAADDYTETTVSAKDGVDKSVINLLESKLETLYSITTGSSLADNNTYDIVIFIGASASPSASAEDSE